MNLFIKLTLRLSLICILLSGCSKAKKSVDYFHQTMLSTDEDVSLQRKGYYGKELEYMGEPTLQKLPQTTKRSIRLITHPAFWASYVLRVEEMDSSSYKVVLKLGKDKSLATSSGLSKLSVEYESNHKRLDSLVAEIFAQLNEYDSTSVASGEYADGVMYLLETNLNGHYSAFLIHANDLEKNPRLASIIRLIQLLIPSNLIPEPNADDAESSLFSILRRNSK